MKRFLKPTTLLLVVGLFLLIILYYNVNPATSVLMPKCPFKMLTGYDCPSCGVQRVVHLVMHGEFIDAFLLNPFLFLVAPYLLAIIYVKISHDRFAVAIKPYVCHHIGIYTYIALYFIWWVVRNTAFWHNLIG